VSPPLGTQAVARVEEIWRFPVKSMAGERLTEATIGAEGILGDRTFAILDVTQGTVVSASDVRHFPGILDCRATVERTDHDGAIGSVRVTLPDGRSETSDSPDLAALLSDHFSREVQLIGAVPAFYTAKQRAWFAGRGLALAPPLGHFADLSSLSIISRATLARLGDGAPASRFDRRRFRMNLVLESTVPGFPEDGWVGRRLRLGADARATVTMPDPRCSMTSLPQGDLAGDADILRVITRMNSLPVGSGGPLPCAGVYAEVAAPGTIHAGNVCTLE
jgi:hypothetical protein